MDIRSTDIKGGELRPTVERPAERGRAQAQHPGALTTVVELENEESRSLNFDMTGAFSDANQIVRDRHADTQPVARNPTDETQTAASRWAATTDTGVSAPARREGEAEGAELESDSAHSASSEGSESTLDWSADLSEDLSESEQDFSESTFDSFTSVDASSHSSGSDFPSDEDDESVLAERRGAPTESEMRSTEAPRRPTR